MDSSLVTATIQKGEWYLPQLVTLLQQSAHLLSFLIDSWLRRDDAAVLIMHRRILNDL